MSEVLMWLANQTHKDKLENPFTAVMQYTVEL